MKNVEKNRVYSRTSALRFVACVFVLVFVFAIFAPSTALAVCPEGYVSDVKDKNLDWQMNGDNLDIEDVKKVVQGWLGDTDHFDFSNVEEDPIVVAIIDTGVNFNHEIFLGKYDENGVASNAGGIGQYDVFLRDKDGNIVSKNTADTSKDASDDAKNRHGTHVAGIIATLIHELNLEKYIKIMPIKASKNEWNETKFSDTAVKNAIAFALANGADVVNMSISDGGAKSGKSTDFDLVTESDAQKAVFVAAAGNNSRSSDQKGLLSGKWFYPAANKYVIGVMNYQETNGVKSLASTSNYGSIYDICAPGSAIFSADGATDDGYKSLGGTSMASPVVAFASALFMLKDRAYCAVSKENLKSCPEVTEYVRYAYNETIQVDKFNLGVFDFVGLIENEVRIRLDVDEDGGELLQNLNDIKTVKLYLDVFPHSYDGEGTVVWKVDGIAKGDGFNFEYTPKNEIGSVTVSAEWTFEELGVTAQSVSCCIEVKYVEYSAEETKQLAVNVSKDGENVSGNENGEVLDVKQNESLTFSVDKTLLENMSPWTQVLWYVDGQYATTGLTFTCKFEDSGEHVVKAKIGHNFTKEITVSVVDEEKMRVEILNIVSISAASALGAVMIAIVVTILVRRRTKSKESNDESLN